MNNILFPNKSDKCNRKIIDYQHFEDCRKFPKNDSVRYYILMPLKFYLQTIVDKNSHLRDIYNKSVKIYSLFSSVLLRKESYAVISK